VKGAAVELPRGLRINCISPTVLAESVAYHGRETEFAMVVHERFAATRGESGCRALYGNAVLRELVDPASAA
jgi:hypothetical protein